MSMRVLVLVVVLCSLHAVRGRSSGPPAGEPANEDLVCREMTPNPTAHGAPQSGDGGYRLNISPEMNETATGFSYVSDTVYQITLFGDIINTFRGFMVQARVPGNTPGVGVTPMLLGSFTPGSGQATLDCDLDAGAATTATIGHSGGALNDVTSVQFNWTAPSTAGEVNFYYTVVEILAIHDDAVSARGVGLEEKVPEFLSTTLGTTGTTDPNPSTIDPGSLNTPSRKPEDYRLQVLNPQNCVRSECDLFIGIDTNTGDSGFLDIYMEGTAEGWLAVGFSDTASMFGADVVSCVRNPSTDTVSAWDGWNPQSRASDVDTIQDVLLFRDFYEDNRISCSVTKKIAPSDTQDLNLNQSLFIIYARRVSANTNPTALSTHSEGSTMVRGISEQRYNPTTSSASVPSVYLGVTIPLLLAIIVMIALP